MLKGRLTREIHEIQDLRSKRKKSSKKKSLSAKRKNPVETKNMKNEEIFEPKLNSTKKPPLFKKQSLSTCKMNCLSPKRSTKNTKKKIVLQNLPAGVHYSDTEKSTKRNDKSRAQSNLEHSLKNKLELSQKVLSAKNTSPSRVEHIIKSSLKKAKKIKITKEKEIQQKIVMSEIKKLEQEHQNKLIRQLNLQKFKKRKVTPQNTQVISRPKKDKLVQMLLSLKNKKSKYRSISSRRPVKENPKTMKNMRSNSVGKEYFTAEFRPYEGNLINNGERVSSKKISTFRESSNAIENDYSETEHDEAQKKLRNTRVKVKRNISLIDTDELAISPEPQTNENPIDINPKLYKYEFEDKNSEEFSSLEDYHDLDYEDSDSEDFRDHKENLNEPKEFYEDYKNDYEKPLERRFAIAEQKPESKSRTEKFDDHQKNMGKFSNDHKKTEKSDEKIPHAGKTNLKTIESDKPPKKFIEKDQKPHIISPTPESIKNKILSDENLKPLKPEHKPHKALLKEEEIIIKNKFTDNQKNKTEDKTLKIIHKQDPSPKYSRSKLHFAATTIQRAFRNHLQSRNISKSSQNTYQDMIKDQIGWRKAQLLSLEYLKEKELEDLQSLAEVMGHNTQFEELLSRTISQRYEQFTKLFKENIDNIETALIEKMDTGEIIEFSNTIKDKKDVINKIIEETNLNSTLPKQELESILKEANSIINKELEAENPSVPTVSTLSQTAFSINDNISQQEKPKRNMGIHIEDTDISIQPMKKKVEEKNFIEEEKNDKKKINDEIRKKLEESKKKKKAEDEMRKIAEESKDKKLENDKIEKGPQILTEVKETKLKTISIGDIMNIDNPMLSPIFLESMNFPDMISPVFTDNKKIINGEGSVSPLPARPSAPLMFLDVDDCNISLESLLNSSTPNNRRGLQGLPLLNLGNLPQNINPIISSDPRIETNPNFVRNFIKDVLGNVDILSIEDELIKGITRNPLENLTQIHELDLGNVVDRGTYPAILNIPAIVENIFDECGSEDIVSTQRFINKADRIHKIMILTVADELLQKYRPYGTRGVPMIWSDTTRIFTGPRKSTQEIIENVITEIEDLARCEVGKIATEEMILSNGHLDEELLQDIREETVAYAIKKEIADNEWIWVDYEFEETQVKMDLADMILSELAGELIQLEL
ncbi:hypothetical protein SteCoe_13490 [Stentor coeruleus]|uniref:DUF4378 domain-containing protein n=1 Tax=Stentor coeruleus TaxID=5963 RepID=A0A1R2C8B2_9CILI|nr:hypothetical protein SteCoe_13490 [Stentor coeruleus]